MASASTGVVVKGQESVAAVTDGLVAHWPLDEATGTTTYDSVANLAARLEGRATWTTGRFKGAVQLDGSTGYLAPPALDVMGTGLTLAAWVNVTNYPGSTEQRIISKATGTDEATQYWSLSQVKQSGRNLLRFRLRTGSTTTTLIASTGELPTRKWFHAVATYDGSTMRLYLDGQEVGRLAKTGTVASNASVPLNIGRNPSGSHYLRGALDDVRIYNRGLSAAEVASLMQGSDGGSDTTAPSVPTGVQATAQSATQVTVQWTASTDDTAVTGYKVRRNGTSVTTATGTSFTDTGVAASTTYSYTVSAVDAAGNESAQSTAASVTTPAAANKPPVVSLTSPANGSTFTAPAGITLAATASDPENRLAQVQFYAGGTLLGSDTSAPYSFAWSSVPAGTYTLTAIARDADGASTTSAPVTVTVGAATVAPWKVAFTASVDHDTKVNSYLLEIFSSTADPATATPIASNDLGKPTPDANRDILVDRTTLYQGLAAGSYKLTVRSMGANGSTRSTALSFTR